MVGCWTILKIRPSLFRFVTLSRTTTSAASFSNRIVRETESPASGRSASINTSRLGFPGSSGRAIAQARRAILDLYQGHNYPLASVNIDMDQVNKTGVLTIHIVEGPQVRIRNIAFIGNKSFSDYKLKDQIRSRSWIFILRDGAYSPEVVEDDVGALRKFYQDKGFFDVRVGRKLIWSPDQTVFP